MLTVSDVSDELYEMIKPFFKGPIRYGETVFKRGISGEEVENLLQSLFGLVKTIKEQERENERTASS